MSWTWQEWLDLKTEGVSPASSSTMISEGTLFPWKRVDHNLNVKEQRRRAWLFCRSFMRERRRHSLEKETQVEQLRKKRLFCVCFELFYNYFWHHFLFREGNTSSSRLLFLFKVCVGSLFSQLSFDGHSPTKSLWDTCHPELRNNFFSNLMLILMLLLWKLRSLVC